MEGLLALLAVPAGLAAALNLALWYKRFDPTDRWELEPSDWLSSFRELQLESGDGALFTGLYADSPAPIGRTLYFLHGNRGNLADRLPFVRFLTDHGFDVFIIDYRGYGRSPGIPSERGVYEDARAGYRWLTGVERIAPERIVVYGSSLGGAIAVELVTGLPVTAGRLVLEGTFPSLRAVAREMVGGTRLDRLLLPSFESAARAHRIRLPVLYIHGTADPTIPLRLGEELYAVLPEPKELFAVPGGGHTDCWEVAGEAYTERLLAFAGVGSGFRAE